MRQQVDRVAKNRQCSFCFAARKRARGPDFRGAVNWAEVNCVYQSCRALRLVQ
jgi:hypothetical protein